jgi:acetoin utilization transport system permease protein
MRFVDGIMLVWRNLLRRKSRTFLTALGVAIGTAAIVGMIALAIGLKENAVRSFDNFQDITVLDVYPGWDEMPGASGQTKHLTDDSVATIKNIPGVAGVMPQMNLYGNLEVQMGRMVGNGIQVIGVDASDAENFSFQVEQGTFLSGAKNEAVISYMVPDYMQQKQRRNRNHQEEEHHYWGVYQESNEARPRLDMVNKPLNLVLTKYTGEDSLETRTYKARVQGMLSEGQGQWGPTLYLPLDMVQEMNNWLGYTGSEAGTRSRNNNKIEYEMIRVKVAGREQVEQVVDGIKSLGYQTWSPMEAIKEINSFFMVVQLILGGIGAISLLVASIGIMNTMFMSILERTREIGIMKVLGATIPSIRKMFLLESGLIGCLGGISGLLTGYVFVSLVNLAPQSNLFGMPGEEIGDIAVIPPWLIIFALGFSIFIGVLSGLLPAHRAAKISPLQALRQE